MNTNSSQIGILKKLVFSGVLGHLQSGGELCAVLGHLEWGGELCAVLGHLESGGELCAVLGHLESGGESCAVLATQFVYLKSSQPQHHLNVLHAKWQVQNSFFRVGNSVFHSFIFIHLQWLVTDMESVT